MRIKDIEKEVSDGFVLVDSETNGTGKMPVENLIQTNFRDGNKTGSPIMKNVVLSGGPGDGKCLFFPERTQEEGNTFILIPGSAFAGFTPSETAAAPLCLIGCNMNSAKFQALNLMPVKDDDGTILGYTFKESTGASLNIFGHQDTRFDGVNTFRPGSYGLRFRIKNNTADTMGIMFKSDIAIETNESIIGAGLLAYLPEAKGAGNYVVRASGTIDEETGAHAGCFILGEMLIPSGKNPQTLGTLGDTAVPVFGLGKNGPGWYLLEANGGGSSGGAESETFIVKVVVNQTDGSASISKTYEQIKEAYEAGKYVEIIYSVGKYLRRAPLTYFSENSAAFVNNFVDYDGTNFKLVSDQLAVLSDNSLEFLAPAVQKTLE